MFATPALRSLKSAYPASHVAVLIRRGLEALLKKNPAVDEILCYEDDRYVETVNMLREKSFDAACLLDRDERLAQLIFQAGIPNRIGYDRPAAARFLTAAVPRTERGMSEIHWSLGLALAAGGIPTEERLQIFRDDASLAAIAAWGLPENEYVILHPGSEYSVPYKRWPVERFAKVSEALVRNGHTVVVTGCADEMTLAGFFPKNDRCKLLFGQTTLDDLIGLVSFCRLLITNDTGPSHIAGAFTRPCIAITGFADPKIYHPYPEPHRALYHPIPCSPCFGSAFDPRDCPYHSCLKTVSVEEVLSHAEVLLANANPPI